MPIIPVASIPGAPVLQGYACVNSATPIISGTTDNHNNIIKLYAEDGITLLAQTTSTGDNSWSIDSSHYISSITDGRHILTFTAEDPGGVSSPLEFKISISTIGPTITTPNQIYYNEGDNSPVYQAEASSGLLETYGSPEYAYALSGDDAAYFTINSKTGNVNFKTSPDYETKSQFSIILSVTETSHDNTTTKKQTINIADVNEAPIANNDTDSVLVNQSVTIDVLVNDTDVDQGDVLTVVSASSSRGLTEIIENKVKFTANSDFHYLSLGQTTNETITYQIRDADGATASGTVTVTVTGVYKTINGHVIKPNANLTGADLTGADLAGEDLTGANLVSADLTGANLSNVILTNADLRLANLSGVDMSTVTIGASTTTLSALQFVKKDLRGKSLQNVTISSLENSIIDSTTNFAGADLTGVDFSKVIFKDSSGARQKALDAGWTDAELTAIGWTA